MENHQIRIAALQRILEQIIPTNNTEESTGACDLTCPKCNSTTQHPPNDECIGEQDEVDPYGTHAIKCKTGGFSNRTKLWHDTLRDVWLQVFKMAGFTAVKEPSNLIIGCDKRPDVTVTIEESLQYLHLDIRTCDPLLKTHVETCSQQPGYAATSGAHDKETNWLAYTGAQGDLFLPICHEHPGRMGEGALTALDRAAARYSPSLPQRNAFKVYWLQRLHTTNTKGVADLVFQQMPFASGNPALPDFAVPAPYPTTQMDFAAPNPTPTGFPISPNGTQQSTNGTQQLTNLV
jgi:hypothetical protein